MPATRKIESDDLSIEKLFNDFYTVPDFQREFVWEEEHVEKLVTDVLDEFYDADGRLTPGLEYFIGSIVVSQNSDGVYELIDGQQRMTTVFLIFCAIRDSLVDAEEDPPAWLLQEIRDTSMDPNTGGDIERYRLTLQYEDSDGVLEHIASRDIPVESIEQTTSSVRNILKAYRTIREFLSSNFDSDPDRIRQFLSSFTGGVKVIRIITPNIANALKVFETVNDRGVGLDAMDLLKNLLFINTASDQYPKLKERWKTITDTLDDHKEKPLRFLRYYIMAHYEIDWHRGLREDDIYRWFSDNSEQCGIDREPLSFVDELVECSQAWANFADGKDPQGRPNVYLQNIGALSGVARQHFVLLLAGRHLPQELFAHLARHIENLFFSYVICRESTKTFERNFARWSPSLRAVTTEDQLNAFVGTCFTPEMQRLSPAFDFAFEELSLGRIQQYRMRYILAKLTQFINREAWANPADDQLERYLNSKVHVEHILPQSPPPEVYDAFDVRDDYDEWAARLGNLALLEEPLNESAGNRSFEEKSAAYAESQFLLTKSLVRKPEYGQDTRLTRAVRDLIQFDYWDSKTIEQRQEMLATLARQVWNMPEVDEDEEEQ